MTNGGWHCDKRADTAVIIGYANYFKIDFLDFLVLFSARTAQELRVPKCKVPGLSACSTTS
jgi:hypothetical protein